MKKLGVILQLIAFLIVLGHNMSAHTHEVMTNNTHCAESHDDESFLDFLADHLWHANTCSDHLETFNQQDELSIAFWVNPETCSLNALVDFTKCQITPPYFERDYHPPFISRGSSRAPPLV